jgi:uncharacterized protein (TIGR03067 family)
MIRCRSWITIAPVLLALLGQVRGDEPGSISDRERLQGTWVAVCMVQNGRPLPEDAYADGLLTVSGDTFTYKKGSTLVSQGVRRLDPAQKPRAFDDTHTDGRFKGNTYHGIYKIVDDDTFQTCNGSLGQDRPTEFRSRRGSRHLWIVYKRVKS